MHIKTARVEVGQLLKEAQDEHLENISIAKHNARCDVRDVKPYKSAAQRALVRSVGDLIALVEQSSDN